MKNLTNVVGVQRYVNRIDDETVEENAAVAYATEHWEIAVEKHYPKKLRILDFEVFKSSDDLLKLPKADTLTMITSNVDSYSLRLLNTMVMKRRFRSIQVLGINFSEEEIIPIPMEQEMVLHGNLYLPPADKEIKTTRNKIRLLKIPEIKDFQDLIDPLLESA